MKEFYTLNTDTNNYVLSIAHTSNDNIELDLSTTDLTYLNAYQYLDGELVLDEVKLKELKGEEEQKTKAEHIAELKKQLADTDYEAIKYLLEGRKVSDIARLLNVSRTALYDWQRDEEFKAELERHRKDICDNINKKITDRLDIYVEQLHIIATTSKSEKNKLQALQYLMNRVLGAPTSKVADVSKEEENKEDAVVDINNILNEIDNANVS